ncbi:MAG: MBL fold metallo-hydrolase [Deltaproteobacteria bacterium]|nr:MBL fold metallo-hydrolase [Deltaproteobacteria bacterium]
MERPSLSLGPVTVFFGNKNGKYPDGNQVMVSGRSARALFDTPLSSNWADPALEGCDLVLLGHAHEDHTAALHRHPGAEVWAPHQDLAAIQSTQGMLAHYGYDPEATALMRQKLLREFHFHPRPDARGYGDGHVWDLGGVTVRALHMPGHTRGHSVLLVEPGGIAFIGDIDLSGFGPYYGDGCSDLREFITTLERIEHLQARVWITYHHKGVITERETFDSLLAAFRQRLVQREEALLAALTPPGRTLEELVTRRFVYPPDFQEVFVAAVERKTISEHLSLLREQGRILTEGERFLRQAG